MSEDVFFELKLFLKWMRDKKYEYVTVDLPKNVFCCLNFIQSCRRANGTYRVEVGSTIGNKNILYRLDGNDYDSTIELFHSTCVNLVRPNTKLVTSSQFS